MSVGLPSISRRTGTPNGEAQPRDETHVTGRHRLICRAKGIDTQSPPHRTSRISPNVDSTRGHGSPITPVGHGSAPIHGCGPPRRPERRDMSTHTTRRGFGRFLPRALRQLLITPRNTNAAGTRDGTSEQPNNERPRLKHGQPRAVGNCRPGPIARQLRSADDRVDDLLQRAGLRRPGRSSTSSSKPRFAFVGRWH